MIDLNPPGVKGTERSGLRVSIIALLVVGVTVAHWWTPQGQDWFHAVHIFLRKLYLLPVILAAIWFDLRAALLTAGLITLVYVPHVIWQWGGQRAENLNQAGEILTIWLTAVISGLFADAEKGALHRLAGDYDVAPLEALSAEAGASGESLYPLLLIVGFIAGVTILVAIRAGAFHWPDMMGNFMAGFFIVFGFLKLLDLRGFVGTYRTYDLLAKALPPWVWAYPFVEVGLGACYLLRVAPLMTNLVTLLLMLAGACGVA